MVMPFYAKRADEEGLKQGAKLFRVFSKSENIYDFKRMKGIKSTNENIENALKDVFNRFYASAGIRKLFDRY
jgi:rubrerythrin